MDFDGDFKIKYLESLVQDNIKTDFPGNQLFYTINRIPPSEENYNPRRALAKNDKIQVLVIDTDGTGTKAKGEVNKVFKKWKTISKLKFFS